MIFLKSGFFFFFFFFRGLNRHLAAFGSEVINCRVDSSQIKQYKTNSNYASYLRYFVADFVSEERALYLDSDMVVTGSLEDLFTLDLQGRPLAVCVIMLFRFRTARLCLMQVSW